MAKFYYYYRTHDGLYKTTKLPKDPNVVTQFLTKEEYDHEIDLIRQEMERLAALTEQGEQPETELP